VTAYDPKMWDGLVGASDYPHRFRDSDGSVWVRQPDGYYFREIPKPPTFWQSYWRTLWDRWGRWSMSGLLALALRIAWGFNPGLMACFVFWFFELHPRCVTSHSGRYRIAFGLSYLGAWCNGLATLANGGRMPVLDYTGTGTGIHVAMTEASRLPLLCDILPMGFATGSIGDVFIIGGLLVALLMWIAQKVGLVAMPTSQAKRVRFGVGVI
jgi:hypothetical protein